MADGTLGAIGLVLGLVALALALVPFLQMVCGAAAIRIDFVDASQPHGRVLLCQVQSKPVENALLKAMGVARATVDTYARFEIRQHDSHEIIASDFRPKLHDLASLMQSLALPLKEPLGAIFCIMEQTNSKGAIAINEAPGEPRDLPLAPGDYWVEVEVAYGNKTQSASKSFAIAEFKDESRWTERAIPKVA